MVRPVSSVVGALFVLRITTACDSRTVSRDTKSHRALVRSTDAVQAPDTSPGQEDNAEGIEHHNRGHWNPAAHRFRKAIMADPDIASSFQLGARHGQLGSLMRRGLHLRRPLNRLLTTGG